MTTLEAGGMAVMGMPPAVSAHCWNSANFWTDSGSPCPRQAMSQEDVAMKKRRTRQPGLFDAAIPLVELPLTRRVETLAVLGILLAEPIAVQGEAAVIQPREVGNDQNRG
jgi:hypothetical protein